MTEVQWKRVGGEIRGGRPLDRETCLSLRSSHFTKPYIVDLLPRYIFRGMLVHQ
jgi:hypothetical protein